jgi:hypothetical protein
MKPGIILSISLFFVFTLPAFGQSPSPQSTPAVVSAEAQKTIEANTPEALPQVPAAKMEKTDAEDDNLRGKVKTIVEESEKPGYGNSRYVSSIEDFDKRGNFVKRVFFDWAHNPWQIMVYGYVDGARVSRDNSIRHEYDPPAMAMPPGAPNAPPDPPRDPRYDYKYENKYTNGKKTEHILFDNSGELLTRTVFNWKGKTEVEVLLYTSSGELNQKYVRSFDKDGNEIDELNTDLIPGKPYGNR